MTFFTAITSAFLAFIIAFWVAWKEKNSIIRWSFVGGLIVFALEAIFAAIKSDALFPEQQAYWQSWILVAKSFVPGTWLVFSLTYARGNYQEFLKRWRYFLAPFAAFLPLVTICFRDRIFTSATVDSENVVLGLSLFGMFLYFSSLVSAVLVLMNFERTFRAAVGTMRWRIKYMIIGLCFMFAVRCYTSSQYILYRSIQPSLEAVNVGVFGVACLFILRSLFRAGYFEVNVYPSQAVLHHSFTFLLTGAYLLLVGLFAKAVTFFGGTEAFPLKAFFILVALVVLTLLLFSDRVRLRTRQFISRHFQRPVYNYRTVWRSFAGKTGTCLDQSELCQSVIKLLADIFESLSVAIWVVDEDERLNLVASSSLSSAGTPQLESVEMIEVLRNLKGQIEPIDIDASKEEFAEALRKAHPVAFRTGGHRLVVPMFAGGNLQGFIMIGDRVGGVPLSTQDIDLLKCAGDQVAASLLNIQLSKKLVQTKELEAFQTMSAFFVHDLKNTASTLSLMLQNLPRHFNDPAFREDALRGISKSAHHIDDLIKRLTLFRKKAIAEMEESGLNKLVEEILSGITFDPNIKIQKNLRELPKQFFDPEELGKVVTNLILNAKDALPGTGEINVETSRQNGWAVLSVSDNGCGMTRDFARNALFRPFQTTKKNGIGIGMFQSKMIVEAHRGKIEVETELGKGTTFRVLLPLTQEPK